MATKKNSTDSILNIEIPEIELKVMKLSVVGDSSLIVHAWADKAKQEILDKQQKKATKAKTRKSPVRDFVQSLYWLDDSLNQIEPPAVNDCETDADEAAEYQRILGIAAESKFGFPSTAFKACAIDAAYQQGLIPKKTTARGAFHILGDFVEIIGVPSIREDMVKIGSMTKTADIRYRGEFREWRAVLPIQFNPSVISASQIASMLNMGGFSNGVGEWRPSRNGGHGRFHVQLADE